MRPPPFAVPPDETMSANRDAAAVHQNDQRPSRRARIPASFERETESNGAELSGEKTWT
jgi:hypothetical protein